MISLEYQVSEPRGGGGGGGGGHGGNKNKKAAHYLLQLGIPALALPAIMFGTVIPFVLPALKLATIFSGLINNTALVAAIMYLARNTALEDENKQKVYFNSQPNGVH